MEQTNHEGKMYVSGVNAQLSYLLGEVLTIIDASIDGDKNKAVKDLIKNRFSTRQNYLIEITTDNGLEGVVLSANDIGSEYART
jgi:hypothetical protein